MAKLLTGYTGVNIFAADDQDLYKGIVGAGSVVFSFGGKLGLTVTASNNAVTATIADGAFSFNGRIVRVATAETVALNVPESGRYRKCEIVARYAKNSGTYVESVTLTPLYSSEDADTASGADALPISTTANDFPLYSFVYSSSGMEQGTKTQHFNVVPSLRGVNELVAQETADRTAAVASVQSGLTQETADRQSAVSALQTSVAANAAAISAETTAREAVSERVAKLETAHVVFNGTASQTVSFNSSKSEFIAIIKGTGSNSATYQARCRLWSEAQYNGINMFVSFSTNHQVSFKRTMSQSPNTQISTDDSSYKIHTVYAIG